MTSPWGQPNQPDQPNDPSQPQQPDGQYQAGQYPPAHQAPGQADVPGQAGVPGQPVIPGQPTIPGGPQKGGGLKGTLVSLLVVAVIAVGGYFVYQSIFKPGNKGSEGDVSSTETIGVFDIRPGNCIVEFPNTPGGVAEVEVTPCASEHSAEVFHEHQIESSDFVDDEDFYYDLAIEHCGPVFETQIEHLSDDDYMQMTWWPMFPTKESWNAGDRLITCVAETDGKMVGSLFGGDVELQ